MRHRRHRSPAGAGTPVLGPAVLIAVVLGLAALAPGASASRAGKAPARVTTPSLGERVNERLGLVKSTIAALPLGPAADRPVTLTLPMGGGARTIDLLPDTVRADGYRLRVQRDDGTLVDVEPGRERTMTGTVRGVPGGVVRATMVDDGLRAVAVLPGHGTWWVEPVDPALPGAAPGDHVVYESADVIAGARTCGSGPEHRTAALEDLDGLPAPAAATAGAAEADGGPTLFQCAEIACDADWYYFEDYGSVEAVEAQILSVINGVNAQYQTDVGITHLVTEIIVRTSPAADPYTTNVAGDLLNEFRNQWLLHHGDVPRDVAHLFTGRNLSGTTVGIAWTGAVCSGLAYGVVQSDCCGSFACTTDLSAHELGHNWGADHCTCSGFTMNASITCGNQFNPSATIPDIIAYRDSIALCLDECDGTIEPLPYCDAASGSAAFEHIARVQFGTIDQASGGTTYSDFTSLSTELERGHTLPLTVTLGSPYATDVGGLWIDWNADRDFDDAGETIDTFSGAGPYVASVTPPPDAALGATRIRVRIQDGAADPFPVPCGTADYGEVEDYTIVVRDPSAEPPANDACATATPITDGAIPFTNVNATTDGPDEPFSCEYGGYSHLESDVWFRYDAACTAAVTLDLCNADFNTKVAVYDQCPDGQIPLIGCDDDACGAGAGSFVVLPVLEGGTYYIRIGGFEGAQGTGLMQVTTSCVAATGACCLADGSCATETAADCATAGGTWQGDDTTCEAAACPSPCPADVDGSGVVDFEDLLAVLLQWGPCVACPEDVDADGTVGFEDLLELLLRWGPCE